MFSRLLEEKLFSRRYQITRREVVFKYYRRGCFQDVARLLEERLFSRLLEERLFLRLLEERLFSRLLEERLFSRLLEERLFSREYMVGVSNPTPPPLASPLFTGEIFHARKLTVLVCSSQVYVFIHVCMYVCVHSLQTPMNCQCWN